MREVKLLSLPAIFSPAQVIAGRGLINGFGALPIGIAIGSLVSDRNAPDAATGDDRP